MPTEPNSRMHQALKAFARKRQEQLGPPFELHPATRRLLQGEVERTFRGPPAPSPSSQRFVLNQLWPRLLAGGFGLAVLFAGATIWLRMDHDQEVQSALARDTNFFAMVDGATEPLILAPPTESHRLAERVRSFELGAATQRPTTPMPALAPRGAAGGGQPAAKGIDSAAARLELALNSPAQGEPLPPGMYSNSKPFQFGRPDALEKKVASTTAAGTSLTDRMLVDNSAAPSQNQVVALHFQQIGAPDPSPKPTTAPTGNILNNFELQRTGDNLRIIDADGSVYEGVAQNAVLKARPAVAPEMKDPGFSFRTVGTNVSLNQLVVFTGEFDPTANLATVAAQGGIGGAAPVIAAPTTSLQQTTQAQSVQQFGRPLENSSNNSLVPGRVAGRALVGGQNELKIEAQQIGR